MEANVTGKIPIKIYTSIYRTQLKCSEQYVFLLAFLKKIFLQFLLN